MEFVNGIASIPPLAFQGLTEETLILAMFDTLGCSVSSMPRNYESKVYSDKWEVFDPEKVTNVDALPPHWKEVYKLHTAPDRTDCVLYRYRYVHTPRDILPQYPRVPCKGIFCISDDKIDINKLTERDLIHVGNEVEVNT